MTSETTNEIFSAMTGGKPLKTYKKTILGRVYVTALNMLTGTPTPEGVILDGDPRKNESGAMFDIFSDQEDYFFRKMNKRHFDAGVLIEFTKTSTPRERTIEEFSDEELKSLINKPFLALQNTLNKTTSVATLFRIESLARELEKSEKVIRAIESRLSEVQEASVPSMPQVIEEEL
jgi:hypothetical protein